MNADDCRWEWGNSHGILFGTCRYFGFGKGQSGYAEVQWRARDFVQISATPCVVSKENGGKSADSGSLKFCGMNPKHKIEGD